MLVKDLKLKAPITVKENDSVQNISKILHKEKIRQVYVLDSKKILSGVVSILDIHSGVLVKGKSSKESKAKDIMVSPVVSIPEDLEVPKAYIKMIEIRAGALPVVKENKLLGVVSLGDCLNQLLKEKKNAK